ncbi:MAG TPA: hypothetical protein VMU57_02520, partial [Edaphobacter sp.]|nr:hypothetical protein [Edaphobacter sp.]
MNAAWIVSLFSYLEPLLCAAALVFLLRSEAVRNFRYLVAFLSVRLGADLVWLSLVRLNTLALIDKHLAYRIYFYVYWSSYALEAALSLLVVYSI